MQCYYSLCPYSRGVVMNKIAKLLEEKRKTKSELVPSTVRIPPETHSFIEELAEHLGLSKQETLAALIDDGVSAAKEVLKLDVPEEVSSDCAFHLLNTNKRNSLEDGRRMMAEGIAAAFYEPWKLSIKRLKKHDVVFLYENGVGVIAYGRATGETLIRDYDGDPDEFYYQKLDDFIRLETPLTAREIKEILGGSIVFLRTMTSIADGHKLLEALEARTAK